MSLTSNHYFVIGMLLSRVSVQTRDIDIAILSVCLSVRQLRSGILWKQLKILL